ncbi:MAG TPA: HlyD family efflux transporter periplasmic adaptor subunit [Terracidiphilus sp.]|nr:HlyD family efflux transporter periplasmic adaptor subunit [Terracidiphilus sp.]
MNLSEALDAALPEIPTKRLARDKPPALDPNLIIREETLDGEPVVGVLQRENNNFFRFPLKQWKLVQLFNGSRTYEEVSEAYFEQTGELVSPDEIGAFAEGMEAQGFWYKTPQEKNLALSERLMAQRSRRAQRKSKLNIAHITFSAWDPNAYFDRLDALVGKLIYNPWSVLAAVTLFIFESDVFIEHWSVIGPDIRVYYSFTGKTFSDIVQFWILLFVLGFIHESAHGLTCKHFGGEVHSMGLMFLYLTPAFYVDVTESWIYATRVQRLWTIIAGIWVEMVICGFAMIIWTNSAPGYWLHDLMYKVILITGVAVVVMNLNPLLKLDGYYFLTESIGMPELKERSTAFVTEWVQSRILRLPVLVTPIPRKRAPLYVLYSLLSGAYSYLVLFTVIRFAYNVAYGVFAEFALVLVGFMAFAIFRSRLRSLRNTVQEVWSRMTFSGSILQRHGIWVSALLGLFIILPLWRDREDAYFVVEPSNPVTVHAAIAGHVTAVYVRGGQLVSAGQPLLAMASVDAAAIHAQAAALTGSSQFTAFQAQLQGQSIGTAAAEQTAASQSRSLSGEVQSSLVVRAPGQGVVLNSDPQALLGNAVASGQSLLTLANQGPLLVRLYFPFSALKRIQPGAEVLLMPPSRLSILHFHMGPMDGQVASLPAEFIGREEYKGLQLPTFYSARIPVSQPVAGLTLGTSGYAKILGARRSIFERAVRAGLDLLRQHVWW